MLSPPNIGSTYKVIRRTPPIVSTNVTEVPNIGSTYKPKTARKSPMIETPDKPIYAKAPSSTIVSSRLPVSKPTKKNTIDPYSLFYLYYNNRLLSEEDQSRLAETFDLDENRSYKITFDVSDEIGISRESMPEPYYDSTKGAWAIEGRDFYVNIGKIDLANVEGIYLEPNTREALSVDDYMAEGDDVLTAIISYMTAIVQTNSVMRWKTVEEAIKVFAFEKTIILYNPTKMKEDILVSTLSTLSLNTNNIKDDIDTFSMIQFIYIGQGKVEAHYTYPSGKSAKETYPLKNALALLTAALNNKPPYKQSSTKPPVKWVQRSTPLNIPYNPISSYGKQEVDLGEGTYATVYLTRKGKELYAIKRSRLLEDQEDLESSILREISSLVRCSHPNIVDLLDLHLESKRVSIVMPAAEGSLHDLIPEISIEAVSDYLWQILSGVSYLHNLDIIHRDLKPQNILVYGCVYNDEGTSNRGFGNSRRTSSKRLVIADFGLARNIICNRTSEERLTKEVFTLWYRPPEVLLEGNYTTKGDIWSVGAILTEMITHRTLFPGDSATDTLYRIFRLLGTPNTEELKGMMGLKDVYNYPSFPPKFDQWMIDNKVPFSLLDLTKALLDINPVKRPSAYAALQMEVDGGFKPNDCIVKTALVISEVNSGSNNSSINRNSNNLINNSSINTQKKSPSKSSNTLALYMQPKDEKCIDKIYNNLSYPLKKLSIVNVKSRALTFILLGDMRDTTDSPYDTLFLSYYIFDTFTKDIDMYEQRSNLLLYAFTSFLISTKIKNVSLYPLEDLLRSVGTPFSEKAVADMELVMLKKLGFNVAVSTMYDLVKLRVPQKDIEDANELLEVLFYTTLPLEMDIKELANRFTLIATNQAKDTDDITRELLKDRIETIYNIAKDTKNGGAPAAMILRVLTLLSSK